MRKLVLFFVMGMVVMLGFNSCKTGYSRSSYIASLEKFVNKVDEDWKTYNDGDWSKADARIEAFEEKYEKYAGDFTKDETKKVAKLMTKYKTLRLKGGARGIWKDITGIVDAGLGVVEGVKEGLNGIGETIEGYTDTIRSRFK